MQEGESKTTNFVKAKKKSKGISGNIFTTILDLTINLTDLIMAPIQKVLGVTRMAYVFLLPNLLIFGIFVITPMIMNFFYSMTGGTELFLSDREFIGLENFKILLECENYLDPNTCNQDLFWRAVYNTIIFVVLQVGGMVIISMLTALILNRNIKGRGFFRSVFFYPVLLSPVVVALIWKWILQREGLLNAIITFFGGEKVLFLLNSNWATGWVIFVSIWAQMGFFTLILLAGLQAIPAELYEAGEIDGAGSIQSFLFITLPLWTQTLFVVFVLSLIRAVQVFDQVFVLTGGGPGTATYYLVQYIYNTAFSNQIPRRGLAAAASLVMGGVLFVLTMLQLRLGRETEAA
jgi:alpha-1,4-digalacturonate transport system permease protein